MFRLQISFSRESSALEKFGFSGVYPKDYFLSDGEDVLRVISSLSRLRPIITLSQIECVSVDDILKDFETINV